jgi:hypothetical protein
MRNLFVVIAVLVLSGCCSVPKEQQEWHGRHLIPDMPLDGQALQEVVGSPDYIVTPVQLSARVKGDIAYRDWVMSQIWEDYWRNSEGSAALSGMHKPPGQWHESEDFLAATVWLYDESLHFRRPPNSGFPSNWFCGSLGFSCQAYTLHEGRVIAHTSLVLWEGLENN